MRVALRGRIRPVLGDAGKGNDGREAAGAGVGSGERYRVAGAEALRCPGAYPHPGRRRLRPGHPALVSDEVGSVRRAEPCVDQRGRKNLGFTRGDHVRERRERLWVDERHGTADHDKRVATIAVRGS